MIRSLNNNVPNQEEIDPTKAHLAQFFGAQVQAMNGLYIDLTINEINDIQSIIEDDQALDDMDNDFLDDIPIDEGIFSKRNSDKNR